ncbi:MAG: tetratricopeptide repeat protein [Bacteriovoracaceae bacterium]|nr:tetratricopeptide repeat protein [Bacteroidota bacterium]
MASEQRIEKLKAMIANDPSDSFSRYALALEYNGINEPLTAIELLEELLKHNEKYLPAYHQLAQLFGKMNKTQEAKKIYRSGIDLAIEQNDEKEAKELREELEELEDEW